MIACPRPPRAGGRNCEPFRRFRQGLTCPFRRTCAHHGKKCRAGTRLLPGPIFSHAAGTRWNKVYVYRVLTNRKYLGEVVHKDKSYTGEHEPILDRRLWDQARRIIADNNE